MTDEAKSYQTAGALRTAPETRLQTRAREAGTDLQRLRRQVAFDRFLARMFSTNTRAEGATFSADAAAEEETESAKMKHS